MSHPIGPPSNEEIDITPTTTTIGTNPTTDVSDTNNLSPAAFGPVELFKVNFTDANGASTTENVVGVRLPFSAGTLEVCLDSADSVEVSNRTYYKAKWKLGTTAITTPAANARSWPTALKTPSASGNFEYQVSAGGAWTSRPVSQFRRMKLKTFTGSPGPT